MRTVLGRFGYKLERLYPRDYPPELIEIIERVSSKTMTSDARIADTCAAAEYVHRQDIRGDIVECGVWQGGSMMAIALTLMRLGSTERDLCLFDTFAGMSEPTDEDVSREGARALDKWRRLQEEDVNLWCYSPLEEVDEAMRGTGYDSEHIRLVKGKVEDTIPERAPAAISLLRLDTDFYESTKHELVHLFPRLSEGGVLILDDYGTWEGARKAADDYFAEQGIRVLLHRSDPSGRVAVKQAPSQPAGPAVQLQDALRPLTKGGGAPAADRTAIR